MPIQGLLSSVTPLDVGLANRGAPIVGGLQAAQNYQLTQAQAEHQQLQNHIANLQTMQQLAASVRYNPSQQNYDNVKKMASAAGLGNLVQNLPPDIKSAFPMIDSAYWASGQGLAVAQARAKILNDQILMGKNASQANQSNFQQGQQPVFPGATGGAQFGNTGIPTLPQGPINNDGTPMGGGNQISSPIQGAMLPPPSSAGGASPVPTPQGMGGMQLQPASPVPSYTGATSTITGSQLAPKAEMEQQIAQAKDWDKFKSAYTDVNKNYLPMKTALDQLDELNSSGLNSKDVLNPLTGAALGLTQRGQLLNRLGDALNLQYIGTLSKEGGMSRIDLPIVRAARGLSPSTSMYPENRTIEINRNRLINESGNAMNSLLPTFDQLGMRDGNKAVAILQNSISKTNAIDPKTGKLDMQKFQDWPNQLPQNVKDAYYTNNYISQGIPVFKNAKGTYITGNQIQHLAQINGMPPQDVIAKYKLKEALQSPYALPQQQIQQLAQLQQQNPQALPSS